jgi:hypothetical protein
VRLRSAAAWGVVTVGESEGALMMIAGGASLKAEGARVTTFRASGLGREGAYLELAKLVLEFVGCVKGERGEAFCWARIADGFSTGSCSGTAASATKGFFFSVFSETWDDWDLEWLAVVLRVSVESVLLCPVRTVVRCWALRVFEP